MAPTKRRFSVAWPPWEEEIVGTILLGWLCAILKLQKLGQIYASFFLAVSELSSIFLLLAISKQMELQILDWRQKMENVLKFQNLISFCPIRWFYMELYSFYFAWWYRLDPFLGGQDDFSCFSGHKWRNYCLKVVSCTQNLSLK